MKNIYSEILNAVTKDDILSILIRDLKSEFTEKIYARIVELFRFFEEDEDPEKVLYSLDSLKGLCIFLFSIEIDILPSITVDDDGFFHISLHRVKEKIFCVFKDSSVFEYLLVGFSTDGTRESMHTGSSQCNQIDI